MMEVGGLNFDFEANRRPRCSAQVRGMLVVDGGKLTWPAPPYEPPPAPKQAVRIRAELTHAVAQTPLR